MKENTKEKEKPIWFKGSNTDYGHLTGGQGEFAVVYPRMWCGRS
jgi:hypothetical protein